MGNDFWDKFLGWSPDMREYFDSLPAFVKQSVIESGAIISSLEDLKQKTAHLLHNA